MNVEMKRIGTITLSKDIDVNKVIYDNPKLGIRLASLGSKYDNEKRYAIYVDGEGETKKPSKKETEKTEQAK